MHHVNEERASKPKPMKKLAANKVGGGGEGASDAFAFSGPLLRDYTQYGL